MEKRKTTDGLLWKYLTRRYTIIPSPPPIFSAVCLTLSEKRSTHFFLFIFFITPRYHRGPGKSHPVFRPSNQPTSPGGVNQKTKKKWVGWGEGVYSLPPPPTSQLETSAILGFIINSTSTDSRTWKGEKNRRTVVEVFDGWVYHHPLSLPIFSAVCVSL